MPSEPEPSTIIALPVKDDDSADILSEREYEVLRLVAYGFANREIAKRLDVSIKSVETYRLRACEKLGLESRVDIVRFAIDAGWLVKSRP